MTTRTDGAVLARGGLITDVNTTPLYELGTNIVDEYGNVFQYVKFGDNVAVTASYLYTLLDTGAVLPVTGTAATVVAGVPLGVAMGTMAAGGSGTYRYGWVCTETGAGKTVDLQVAASCAANAGLGTTATPGVLDDATSANKAVGIVLNAARAASQGVAPAILSNPIFTIAYA